MKKLFLIPALLLCFIFLLFALPCYGQNQEEPPVGQEETSVKPKNSPVREEVQRYMGYEPLLSRYLTLPTDVQQGTNVTNRLVDIGFWLVSFIPILFLYGLRKKPAWGIFFLLLFFILLAFYAGHSQFVNEEGKAIATSEEALSQYFKNNSFSDKPLSFIGVSILGGLHAIFVQVSLLEQSISGEKDYLTYPILIGLALLIAYFLFELLKEKPIRLKALVWVTYTFSFFWLLFSGGIIWYGLLFLPVGLMLIFQRLAPKPEKEDNNLTYRVLNITFWTLSALWVILAGSSHLTKLNYRTELPENFYDPAVTLYQMGKFNEEEVLDSYFKNLPNALKKINAEDTSLVYRAGTFFTMFIKKNDRRVFEDNQLRLFDKVAESYRDKSYIANAFKAAGFKYIIIGLNLYRIDETPEKSLKQKFEVFMGFLGGNPNLELLATDNQVVQTNPKTGKEEVVYEVFGKNHKRGTYAIFELK